MSEKITNRYRGIPRELEMDLGELRKDFGSQEYFLARPESNENL